jgi:hypothetical protein
VQFDLLFWENLRRLPFSFKVVLMKSNIWRSNLRPSILSCMTPNLSDQVASIQLLKNCSGSRWVLVQIEELCQF